MPAVSEPVALPHTFRPFGVRWAVYLFSALLLGTVLAVWFAFSPEVRAKFNGLQIGTVVALGLGGFACGHAMARSKVVATVDRVRVVNGYKSRSYEWNQIIAVSLRNGAPWATLDLSDGTTKSAMAFQGSDGSRAVRGVRQFRALLDRASRTDHDS